ncbi:MAG: HTH-type transcriptional regulator TsaR [Paracidovorax wautersii]|uniref:HTH-type transcriptional regulator TsaR n=1 Tax=Paracidovorax wautersii TaxID=1177982 RepID=A0A7V8JP31_9BURK|nr:MAG: HTH-type transcriptional regulator TsaR [Paracidovorax wautersii]
MKLTALNSLVAAIEEGSLRGAARRVGVSQPALTRTIRELEHELAAALLLRTSRGVQPTPQGKVLYEHALKAHREIGIAVDTIRQMGGNMIGELHLCAVPVAVMLLIPETLRTFGQEFPNVRLRVSEELYVAQLQRLRSGEVDVTVGGIPDDLSTGEFVVERLMKTTMVPVARRGSPWLKARRLILPLIYGHLSKRHWPARTALG